MPQSASNDAAFKSFCLQRRRDLARIAAHTRNEHQLGDVRSEAWIMAFTLSDEKGISVDFSDPAFQDLLIAYLYQHLVRYTELNVRHAARLDRAASSSDQNDGQHSLMRSLISDDGQHPLSRLVDEEALSTQGANPDLHASLAGAYVRLLERFNNRMKEVANHLLISESYAYRRCAHARLLAMHQRPIPAQMRSEFEPGPWRRYRLQRVPIQLTLFKFDCELPLES